MKEKLKELLIKHEGLRLHPYRCSAGKLTIGVGRNLDDVGILKAEALYLLENDIISAMVELESRLPVFYDLSEVRKIVLIDMCFNLGITRLLKFKKMIAALEEGNFKKAAAEMADSQWANQVGARALRLMTFMVSDEMKIF